MPVDSYHPEYRAKLSRWIKQRDAYDGEDAVRPKGETYLPRPSGFTGQYHAPVEHQGTAYYDRSEYGGYLSRAKWYGAPYRTATGLVGVVTSKPVAQQGTESFEWHFDDITLSGTSLNSLTTELLKEQIIMGRYGMLVMWSDTENRPFWIGYNAERICNWHTQVVGGKHTLTRVILREDVEELSGDGYELESKAQWRELYLDAEGHFSMIVWRKSGSEFVPVEPPETPMRSGRPLDFLPFVIINTTHIGVDVEKGILEDLVSLSYDYYRHSADYEHGLHLTALPTGVITGFRDEGVDLYVGSSTFMQIPDPEARVYFLEFHGHGLQSHERAMDTDKKEMAAIGARILEPAPEVQETLGAFAMRHGGDTGSLRNVVHTASQALTWLTRVHAWWARETEDVADDRISMGLNTDFVSAKISPQHMQVLMEALNSGNISFETWIWNLQQGEIIPPGIDVEAERERIEAMPPLRLSLNGTGPMEQDEEEEEEE